MYLQPPPNTDAVNISNLLHGLGDYETERLTYSRSVMQARHDGTPPPKHWRPRTDSLAHYLIYDFIPELHPAVFQLGYSSLSVTYDCRAWNPDLLQDMLWSSQPVIEAVYEASHQLGSINQRSRYNFPQLSDRLLDLFFGTYKMYFRQSVTEWQSSIAQLEPGCAAGIRARMRHRFEPLDTQWEWAATSFRQANHIVANWLVAHLFTEVHHWAAILSQHVKFNRPEDVRWKALIAAAQWEPDNFDDRKASAKLSEFEFLSVGDPEPPLVQNHTTLNKELSSGNSSPSSPSGSAGPLSGFDFESS